MSADIEQTLTEPAAVPRELIARKVARRRTFGFDYCIECKPNILPSVSKAKALAKAMKPYWPMDIFSL